MLPFKKMHGLGNDFIMMKASDLPSIDMPVLQVLAQNVCDRHFGVGADGLIVAAAPQDTAQYDLKFIYINSDGSIAEMCGNGIRCFTRYVIDEGLWQGRSFRAETGAGLIQPTLNDDHSVTVNMGCPIVEPSQVPFVPQSPYEVGKSPAVLNHDGDSWEVWPISMGNPHAILFMDAPHNQHLNPSVDGRLIETHLQFPAKTNVEFTSVLNAQTYQVVVWERGCGFTLACGTGACATAVAAIASGRARASQPVDIRLPGGTLSIEWSGDYTDPVLMTGPADYVATGHFATSFSEAFTKASATSSLEEVPYA
jgi:diaminopimelate epimerase